MSGSDESARGSNVQVVVRSRPPTEAERRAGDASVLGCFNKNEVHVLHANNRKVAGGKKVYTFDQSYPGNASQHEVYETSVRPLVEEVLAGFNCTVFAYGQTGTGKTYTMEGEMTADAQSPHAGVIPRSVHTIFDQLNNQALEYSVKVSFLEIYNEEFTDLLGEEERELRIFEDPNGKRGMLVTNLEEVIVTSAEQVFSLLERSWQKRRTAETLLNKNSSRSHCVFIITVHTKECDEDGEDVIKTGKLYLVDLAGSECVGKSGAQNQRAKEAGKINQSLLTLGRVINALVDKASYIPYRDSKLTRLLQESLGGRAKTVIIATVSPAALAIDETISTLEYAHRAKNIRNRPQVNQKMTKRAYMKDLEAEITSLKRENEALRLKNGVYLPPEKYELLIAQQRGDTLRLEEMLFQMKAKDVELESTNLTLAQKVTALEELTVLQNSTAELLRQTQDDLANVKAELANTQLTLEHTQLTLEITEGKLVDEQVKVEEANVVIKVQENTEKVLHEQANELVQSINQLVDQKDRLHAKIDRKDVLEANNQRALDVCSTKVSDDSQIFSQSINQFRDKHSTSAADVQSINQSFNASHKQWIDQSRAHDQSNNQSLTKSINERVATEKEYNQQYVEQHQSVNQSINQSSNQRTSHRQQFHTELNTRSAVLVESIQSARSTVQSINQSVNQSRVSHVGSINSFSDQSVKSTNQFGDLSRNALSSSADRVKSINQSISQFGQSFLAEQAKQRIQLNQSINHLINQFEEEQSNKLSLFIQSTQSFLAEHLISIDESNQSINQSQEQQIQSISQWQRFEQESYANEATEINQSINQYNVQSSLIESQAINERTAFDTFNAECDGSETSTSQSITVKLSVIDSTHEKFIAESQSNVAEARQLVDSILEQQNASISQSEILVNEACAQVNQSINDIASLTDSFTTSSSTSLSNINQSVDTLAHKEWKGYQETCSTPKKAKFHFRQDFARSGSVESIKSQYRADKGLQSIDQSSQNDFDNVSVTSDVSLSSDLAAEPAVISPVDVSSVLVPAVGSAIPVLSQRTSSAQSQSHSRANSGSGRQHRRNASSITDVTAAVSPKIMPVVDVNENTAPSVNVQSGIPQRATQTKAATKFKFGAASTSTL